MLQEYCKNKHQGRMFIISQKRAVETVILMLECAWRVQSHPAHKHLKCFHIPHEQVSSLLSKTHHWNELTAAVSILKRLHISQQHTRVSSRDEKCLMFLGTTDRCGWSAVLLWTLQMSKQLKQTNIYIAKFCITNTAVFTHSTWRKKNLPSMGSYDSVERPTGTTGSSQCRTDGKTFDLGRLPPCRNRFRRR